MKIFVKENKIEALKDDSTKLELNLGAEDIRLHGFQVVDYVIDQLYVNVKDMEEISVDGDTLEANMIARKLEDKLKREVRLVSSLRPITSY